MMKIVLVQDCHSVGESNLHLQFTPKYRKKVFEDDEIRLSCELIFKGVAEKLKVGLAGIGFGPDHCHLFVCGWKNYSIAELARKFKGIASRLIRKNYHARLSTILWGDAFWTGGYFYRTVGAVTAESMKKYVIESQEKHWVKTREKPIETQTTLLQFK